MSDVRTVTLELLRHGPEHNQLLSPSVQYLALCGNHPAMTVTMPFEHQQLLARYRALRYQDSEETQALQFTDTAQVMADLLGKVPGLIAELAECPCQDDGLIQLRLILSASELAMLPFELSNAPNGFPGAGQSLALQSQAPLCVTREVRRVSKTRFQWPQKPKVLFIAASPDSVGDIPLEAHLLALRRVVEPWVSLAIEPGGAPGVPSDPQIPKDLREHLFVLPDASPKKIQKALAEADGEYTHVHILAHGLPFTYGGEKRYGLALHSDTDPKKHDIVDGARLAAILRTYRKDGSNELSCPAVVTIASCDGGNVGSVIVPGASVAHALHEGGIPLVVASQFPLSFAGSILMTEVLYEGLLWGVDPRTLLNDLRRQLKARVPEAHDWASLVAYAALPADLHSQLPGIRLKRARLSINASLRFMDRVTKNLEKYSTKSRPGDAGSSKDFVVMELARHKMKVAVERLKKLLNDTPVEKSSVRAVIYGLLASTEKRDAKILFKANSLVAGPGHSDRQSHGRDPMDALKSARDYYRKAFVEDRASSWALVQDLSLTLVLEGASSVNQQDWITARVLSEKDLYRDNRMLVSWAHSNLTELYLLATMLPGVCERREAEKLAKEHARRLVLLDKDSLEIYSTCRQIERYTDWFNELPEGHLDTNGIQLAKELLEILQYSRDWE